ncbi:MAG: hypothetical protein FWH38_08555 [Treponema sp.]|nr:hypothetical protein [Treponema sp.]
MESVFNNFINTASVFEKGVFLMAAGVLFVFAVQVVFYLTVKLWPRGKKAS